MWTLGLSIAALIFAVGAVIYADVIRRRVERPAQLLVQVAEAETALAGLYDKYNILAARFRKREQRAAERVQAEVVESPGTPKHELRSAVNRAWLAARRGITVPALNGETNVGSDQDEPSEVPG